MKINKPNRVTRTYRQNLTAPPSEVFPLLCPVREADWLEQWDPLSVLTNSGLVEPDCVFVTRGLPRNSTWYVTRHEPHSALLEILKITPDVTACKITIQLRSSPGGCDAFITYAHTSLGPEGDAFIQSFTESFYQQFMRDWESRLNHYLTTGAALRGS